MRGIRGEWWPVASIVAAGICCAALFYALHETRRECDTRCLLVKINETAKRIEAKIDAIDRRYTAMKCDMDMPLGSPQPRKASFQ